MTLNKAVRRLTNVFFRGEIKSMEALKTGVLAPDFDLQQLGRGEIQLSEALKRGPAVLAFFKVSCPVCQYAFPLLERVYQANKYAGITFLAISQDDPEKTKTFIKQFGITFPVALDSQPSYKVSNAYGLTNVPTIFYVAPSGEIEISSVGWSKRDIEQVNCKLAEVREQQPALLWRPGEDIREFRGG